MSAVVSILIAALSAGEAPADIEVIKEKIVCKRVYNNDTGSHFKSSKRICAPESAWKEQEVETDRVLRNVTERGSSIVNGPDSPARSMGGAPQ